MRRVSQRICIALSIACFLIMKALNTADPTLPLLVSEFVGFSKEVQNKQRKTTAKYCVLRIRCEPVAVILARHT